MNLLKKRKIYTINETKILNKEALMLPQLMWFYTLDSKSNKLLYLSLAIKSYDNLGYTYYYDILNKKIEYTIFKDLSETLKINMYCKDDQLRDFLKSYPDKQQYFHSFIDNCNTTDIYTEEDIFNIYKLASKTLFDNEEEWWQKAVFNEENVKMAIDSVHREYMLEKKAQTNQISYLKTLKYLQFNNFTIDSGKVLDGKLTMLPKMKWIYIESKDNPHIIQIDLAVFTSKTANFNNTLYGEYYVGLVYHHEYKFINNQIINYNFDRIEHNIVGKNPTLYAFDFHENVLYDDIYNLEDLKTIIKNVANEISYELCEKGNENNINNISIIYPNKNIDYNKIKTLTYKTHRLYMDKK